MARKSFLEVHGALKELHIPLALILSCTTMVRPSGRAGLAGFGIFPHGAPLAFCSLLGSFCLRSIHTSRYRLEFQGESRATLKMFLWWKRWSQKAVLWKVVLYWSEMVVLIFSKFVPSSHSSSRPVTSFSPESGCVTPPQSTSKHRRTIGNPNVPQRPDLLLYFVCYLVFVETAFKKQSCAAIAL